MRFDATRGGSWNDANDRGEVRAVEICPAALLNPGERTRKRLIHTPPQVGHQTLSAMGHHSYTDLDGCYGCFEVDGYYPMCEVKRPHANQVRKPKLAQKLGRLQPFIAVFPQECMGQLACFGPT
jgi:hypothetical protein